MLIRMRGKSWKVREIKGYRLHGECDKPDVKGKEIRLREGMRDKNRLETLIHEMLHAGLWDLSEDAVAEVAEDMAENLLRDGWRRTND